VTASQLRGFAERAAAVLHIPRRALDSAEGELAILIGELCDTPHEAETLTGQLCAETWGRFDFAEVRRRAEILTGKTIAPPVDWVDGFVTRLCILPSRLLEGIVQAAEVRAELRKAVSEAHSEEHATRALVPLMTSQDGEQAWRPTPEDVRAVIAETPKEPPPVLYPADPACKKCDGSGFVYIEKAHKHPITGLWYSGTKNCRCRTKPRKDSSTKTKK
jgi:hypothetical protein